VLWRHGQTVWNAERRFQGQSDIPLDVTGQAQAERAARLLAALRPDLIVSSDLSRAAQTAAPLARLTCLDITLDKDLRERHGGRWEGLTDTEIRTQYPAEHAAWNPPDGEPSAVVADRVAGALHRIAEAVLARGDGSARTRGDSIPPDPPGRPPREGAGHENAEPGLAVVVSHGAALRLGMSRLLGIPDELFGVLGPLSNCSWSVLGRRHGRWRLIEHNAGTLPEPILSDDR
jgi:glucosyl-3-phosphoglycerate phosphatase